MKTFFSWTSTLCLLLSSFFSFAQVAVDTIRSENPEHADTIVIYEEPVILSTQLEVYRPKVKPSKQTKHKLFVSLDAGVGTYYEYNNICEECKEYADKIKSSTTKRPAYMVALRLSMALKKWMAALSLGGYQQQARFKYVDGGNEQMAINRINTINGSLSIGYWVKKKSKKSKVSLIPSLAFTVSKPYEISGKLYRQDNTAFTAEMKDVLEFRPLFYLLGLETKLLYKLAKNSYLTLTPSYHYDLKSIVSRTGPFTIQRHLLSCQVGLVLALK